MALTKSRPIIFAEIKLRNINREYILKRTQETDALQKEIADLEENTVNSPRRIKAIIVKELENVAKKYGTDRRTTIRYEAVEEYQEEQQEVPDYPVNLFVTRDGYLKKITPQSLRMSGEQKLKEGDRLVFEVQTTNRAEVLVFTDRCQVYKTALNEFKDTKASVMGDYLPTKLRALMTASWWQRYACPGIIPALCSLPMKMARWARWPCLPMTPSAEPPEAHGCLQR